MSVQRFDLPDECWELIFRSFDHHRHFDYVSLVCRKFLCITNRLHSSLTISDPTISTLPQLLLRFRALKSLDLSNFQGDLNRVLHLISRSGLLLDSLNISNRKALPVHGLQVLGSTMRNLRALICSRIRSLRDTDLLVIAYSFPLLQELHIDFPGIFHNTDSFPLLQQLGFDIPQNLHKDADSGITALFMRLKNLCRVKIGNRFITDVFLHSLFRNCEFLREIVLEDCSLISQEGIASAILRRPNLTSISFRKINDRWINGRPCIIPEFIDSLMSLKSLTTIEFSKISLSDDLLCSIADDLLPLEKLILRKCSNYTYAGISCLLANCQSVQYLHLQEANFLTDRDMRELSLFLRNVTFINLSDSSKLTNSTFLTLMENCPLLNEIRMERTGLGKEGLKEDCLKDFVIHPRVKTLYLGHNLRLRNEDVRRFASLCPNLEHLDLRSCWEISEGVFEVLKDCHKITHLSLAYCAALTRFEMDFEVPKVEVLNLSESRIGDEALSIVSKTCCGLTHLDLQNCFLVTENGVKQVVEKCRRLREINLKHCNKVSAKIIPWMVFSRSSLRKIMAPPGFRVSESQRRLFLRHGCLVN